MRAAHQLRLARRHDATAAAHLALHTPWLPSRLSPAEITHRGGAGRGRDRMAGGGAGAAAAAAETETVLVTGGSG